MTTVKVELSSAVLPLGRRIDNDLVEKLNKLLLGIETSKSTASLLATTALIITTHSSREDTARMAGVHIAFFTEILAGLIENRAKEGMN